MRLTNTNGRGGAWSAAEINLAWQKARAVPGYHPAVTRKDACGAFINRHEYGRTSTYGWEIDHIHPVAQGGTDHFNNLQPLQWQNNRHKGDTWPNWSCALSA